MKQNKDLKQYIKSISVADIENMNKDELLTTYSKIREFDHNEDAINISNIKSLSLLKRIISYKLQEIKYNKKLNIKLLQKLEDLTNESDKTNNQSTNFKHLINPNATITKFYKGTEYKVTKTNDGFKYNDKLYNSLSQIAYIITNQKISGVRFFNLDKKTR